MSESYLCVNANHPFSRPLARSPRTFPVSLDAAAAEMHAAAFDVFMCASTDAAARVDFWNALRGCNRPNFTFKCNANNCSLISNLNENARRFDVQILFGSAVILNWEGAHRMIQIYEFMILC